MSKRERGIALVTGASSGIGLVTAQALLRDGYQVFGTSRKPMADIVDGITMLVCDVIDDQSVQGVVDEVLKRTGRIDLLVNNAGIGLLGGAEESTTAQAKAVFDVNVFGTMRMAWPRVFRGTQFARHVAQQHRHPHLPSHGRILPSDAQVRCFRRSS